MNIHKNARTTPQSRAEIVRRVVRERQPARQVAAAFGISERTVRKWVARARPAAAGALADRSSRPHGSPGQTPLELQELIERLRRQRWTGAEIAHALHLSPATVARHLRRQGLARLRALEPPVPVVRYEYRHPGALVHIDIKKLGRIGRPGHRVHGDRRTRVRGIGWEFVHVAVDDATRLAYVEVLPDEQGVTCVRFLWHALAWFRRHGIRIRRLMTDNGSGYLAHVFTAACQGAHLRHVRTRPYTPRTNGKAERFIQTLLREWAYRRPYATSTARRTALPSWLHHYNWHRNHGSLQGCPPMSRLVAADNLMRLHS
jgi:transposase InsO family protein